ncbi:hypothetical protein LR48_Vigan09g141800 [Vigna angularis]|uniref:Uncharacterized protein n=1 Tax=Phaseolus angularis TaxID=3914 RepID=A0A0L9VDL3_PHAAN|nr:hypothetical protein LR48_Vigan09g141800 [Vigna angularis]
MSRFRREPRPIVPFSLGLFLNRVLSTTCFKLLSSSFHVDNQPGRAGYGEARARQGHYDGEARARQGHCDGSERMAMTQLGLSKGENCSARASTVAESLSIGENNRCHFPLVY